MPLERAAAASDATVAQATRRVTVAASAEPERFWRDHPFTDCATDVQLAAASVSIFKSIDNCNQIIACVVIRYEKPDRSKEWRVHPINAYGFEFGLLYGSTQQFKTLHSEVALYHYLTTTKNRMDRLGWRRTGLRRLRYNFSPAMRAAIRVWTCGLAKA